MQVFVFVRDIGNLSVYVEKLVYYYVDFGVLYSEVKKMEWVKIIVVFEDGEFLFLLVIDIVVCGLDIENLLYVIYVDIFDEDGYVYRLG